MMVSVYEIPDILTRPIHIQQTKPSLPTLMSSSLEDCIRNAQFVIDTLINILPINISSSNHLVHLTDWPREEVHWWLNLAIEDCHMTCPWGASPSGRPPGWQQTPWTPQWGLCFWGKVHVRNGLLSLWRLNPSSTPWRTESSVGTWTTWTSARPGSTVGRCENHFLYPRLTLPLDFEVWCIYKK